jgi:2'-5' RNA ligase
VPGGGWGGALPGRGRRRGDVAALLRLQQAVERASAALGFPPEERAFRPHLTLGRVAPEDLGSLTRIPEHLAEVAAQPALPMPVDRVTLFRSLLSRAGTVYSLVETFPLGGDLS